MNRRHGAHLLAGVLVSLTLVLGGCSQDAAEPSPLPSSGTPSGSAGVSESPSASVEVQARNPKSAVAFGRYYVGLINFAIQTGDTGSMRTRARRSCSACSAIARSVEKVYEKSGHVKGGDWNIRNVEYVRGEPHRSAVIRIGVHIRKQAVFDSPGAEPRSSVPNNGLVRLHLRMTAVGWTVDRLDAFE